MTGGKEYAPDLQLVYSVADSLGTTELALPKIGLEPTFKNSDKPLLMNHQISILFNLLNVFN